MSTKAPSQFRSNYKAMVIVARHGHDILHPVTGTKIDEVKRLSAEFGVHRGEYSVVDPASGREQVFADIAGYFYDLDVDAETKGWSDDEKEAMRQRLVVSTVETPDFCQAYERPAPMVPWPTYDTTAAGKIPILAGELGLVHEAIEYERANQNRDAVIASLEKVASGKPKVEENPADPGLVEELTAV